MKLTFKTADKSNYYQTEHLTREAFWNLYKSGCDEHLVLRQLRKSKCYVEKLDIVAVSEDDIIGHIISTKAKVIDRQGKEHEVLCVGPFAVLPALQNKGIGTKLFNFSIAEAKKTGFGALILFGNPGYYHRFGFRNAVEFEITTRDDQNFEPFMAMEIREKGLAGVKGRFFEDDAFTTREDELAEFEKKFPFKVKGKPKIDITQ